VALYVSKGKRLRRAVIAVLVAGALAFLLGLLIGRQQVPSVDSRVASVQSAAANIATGLERLDVEYQKVLAGTDSLQKAVLQPLDETVNSAQKTLNRAPWITAAQRSALLDALAATRASAAGNDPLATFEQHLTDTAALVRAAFGIAA
jgi:hypothetical protein